MSWWRKLFFLNPKGQLSSCSWIAKIDSGFITEHSLAEKTFRELIKSKQVFNFKNLVRERLRKNLKGCPFIDRYQLKSYFPNANYRL